ncbi:MAG TPA: ribbon-helix-helix domain-containing protein [Candidatus Lokiarchaeia archaeon]|nr:ribbon-helix-helix domain-containing protein [Candidatus Lokiarchaeia archaeon]
MEETITISSIRIAKHLAEKLDVIARREGTSRAEIIRRSLEAFLAKQVEPHPKSAQEVLDLVYRRTGHKPTSIRSTKEVFDELYKEESLS